MQTESILGLNKQQRDAVGLTYVFDQLKPDSPYGVYAKQHIKVVDDVAALQICFDHIDHAIQLTSAIPVLMDALRFQLKAIKNIKTSIVRLKEETLSQVELFEVKAFLLSLEKITAIYHDNGLGFADIQFISLAEALTALDPHGKRMQSYVVESLRLHEIRKEKYNAEKQINEETDAEKLSVLKNKRIALIQLEIKEENKVLADISEALRKYIKLFERTFLDLMALDLCLAKARLAIQFCEERPLMGGDVLILKDMVNPEVVSILAKENKHMTPVTVALSHGCTVITGANMGGKSVVLKTAVLNIVLARCGFYCCAKEAQIPMFEQIVYVSEEMQDVHRGLSSFGAEVVKLKEIAAADALLFVALDELARGTNPEEGECIVAAVMEYLNEKAFISLITTHYDVRMEGIKHYQVKGLDHQRLGAKQVSPSTLSDFMDYTLVEADAQSAPARDALNICKLLGLPKELINKIENQYIGNYNGYR